MTPQERDTVVLAGLLHDIGKFYQRTGRPPEGYQGQVFDREDLGASGAHARWSASFISRYVPAQWSGAGWPVLRHHDPGDDERSRIVQQAEHLSAALDREHRPPGERGDVTYDRLGAILERIVAPDAGSLDAPLREGRWTLPLRALSIERESAFPLDGQPRVDLRAEYAGLWDNFAGEAEKLKGLFSDPQSSFDAYLESLLHLLHKYTWAIPSATYRDYPEIPLFDHLRATAAVAACLADTLGRPAFRLVIGDLSGIQAFLYSTAFPNETQDGAAKRMRGKSFALTLLLQSAAFVVRQALGLYPTNVLWASGGHFALLAPDTEQVQRRAAEIGTKIRQALWDLSRGDLGLLLVDVPVEGEELSDFGKVLDRVRAAMGQARLQRNPELFESPRAWRWDLLGDVCRACGRDATPRELNDPEGRYRCSWCRSLERLGQQLPTSRFVARYEPDEAGEFAFSGLGVSWRLLEGHAEITGASAIYALPDRSSADLDFLPRSGGGAIARGFLLTATWVPREGRQLKEFPELADEARGAGYLGILRMDVDNLGAIMSRGLPARERSISKLAAVSRTLDWFFAGYLNGVAEAHGLYTTYAGGDDLFLVGPWDRVVEGATAIQREFRAYACENPALHISGGIALCRREFPIGRAAAASGALLDDVAKGPPRPGRTGDTDKDALAIFGEKVPWPVWERLYTFAHETLIPALPPSGGELSRSFIHFLLRLYRQHIDPCRSIGPAGEAVGAWVPKFLYSLQRNVTDRDLAAKLHATIPGVTPWLGVLATYTALRTRPRDDARGARATSRPETQREEETA